VLFFVCGGRERKLQVVTPQLGTMDMVTVPYHQMVRNGLFTFPRLNDICLIDIFQHISTLKILIQRSIL
jgi:hypothetical protein